jgi:LemA protein
LVRKFQSRFRGGLASVVADAWSNIDTELLRRYELLPNIVATVKGYAKHEQEILERVIELRNVCLADHGSVTLDRALPA